MAFIILNELGKNGGPIAVRAEHVQTVKGRDLMGPGSKTNRITGEREPTKEGESTVITLQGGSVLVVQEVAESVLEMVEGGPRANREHKRDQPEQQPAKKSG